jgi:flagellar biosynthesis/type III secretory pathway protein FliH
VASIALTDRAPVLIAVEGTRIPRRAWSCVAELTQLLDDAGEIVRAAELQAEEVRRRAQSEGYAAGVAEGQAQMVRHALETQRAAREFAAASEGRIVMLAVSILERIAPSLGEAKLVTALAAEALRGVQAERHLRVHVSHQAEQATRALLDQWTRAHPEILTAQVYVDASLPPFGCVVESELGRIEAGLSAQLETVRERLAAISAESNR